MLLKIFFRKRLLLISLMDKRQAFLINGCLHLVHRCQVGCKYLRNLRWSYRWSYVVDEEVILVIDATKNSLVELILYQLLAPSNLWYIYNHLIALDLIQTKIYLMQELRGISSLAFSFNSCPSEETKLEYIIGYH